MEFYFIFLFFVLVVELVCLVGNGRIPVSCFVLVRARLCLSVLGRSKLGWRE